LLLGAAVVFEDGGGGDVAAGHGWAGGGFVDAGGVLAAVVIEDGVRVFCVVGGGGVAGCCCCIEEGGFGLDSEGVWVAVEACGRIVRRIPIDWDLLGTYIWARGALWVLIRSWWADGALRNVSRPTSCYTAVVWIETKSVADNRGRCGEVAEMLQRADLSSAIKHT
jgi:hypothetical protein